MEYRERVIDYWRKIKPYCFNADQGDIYSTFLVEFINLGFEKIFLPELKENLIFITTIKYGGGGKGLKYYEFYSGSGPEYAFEPRFKRWLEEH
ncbi:MAG TPA: hypothetical protein VMV58_03270 [Desulfosporosinus sp.]|nr:hypothetical protein [Desulfosporosinus sp.]